MTEENQASKPPPPKKPGSETLGASSDPRYESLEIPTDASKNVEIAKYYTFNETGNIMMANTIGASAEIEESVRTVFSEVSVFFAAMTKALSSENLSLYDYTALEKIIDRSGCFIRVLEQDIYHETNSWGANFSKELFQGLLGLATGAGALNFASAMISSIGKTGLTISGESERKNDKVGNIVFVCEYLMGMPSVSTIVVNIDATSASNAYKAGPCFSAQRTSTKLKMHKDTYMFVTPTFIREYAGDLDSIGTETAYGHLITSMKSYLKDQAT